MRRWSVWLLGAFAACVACAGGTEDDLAAGRDADGGGAEGGTSSGDAGPWPDGAPSGGTSSGGVGASGGAAASGGAGGTTGGSAGNGGGGVGGAGGASASGGSGGSGCTLLTCKNYDNCQDEMHCACPAAPPESCNLKDDDCNGACDEGASCRVAVHRSYSSATGEHFYTTSASEAACCGFVVEFSSYFHLYANTGAGLEPFYRCSLAIGKHFYTTSATCEGAAGVNEGVLGYIGTSATCGSVPLYRLVHVSNGDHFYTTSEAEKDGAVAGSSYLYESIVGYVWTSGG